MLDQRRPGRWEGSRHYYPGRRRDSVPTAVQRTLATDLVPAAGGPIQARQNLRVLLDFMDRLWAKTISFSSVNAGDQLPILVKWETEDSIAELNALFSPDETPADAVESAAPPPKVSSAAAPIGALLSYVVELLEKAFPITAIMSSGSSLSLEHLASVEAQDIISLSGRVVGKREEEGLHLVDCQVEVENERGQTIARALATVSL